MIAVRWLSLALCGAIATSSNFSCRWGLTESEGECEPQSLLQSRTHDSSGRKLLSLRRCSVGASVPCPTGGNACAGNQCCPDGTICPSADTNFDGCPKPEKLQDCVSDTMPGRRKEGNKTAAKVESTSSNSAVTLECSGDTFIDCWTFFDYPDPTHGDVVYVSESEALASGLYSVQNGTVYLKSQVGQNQPAKSIRLQSKAVYQAGHVWLIDIQHMPTGMGTWPAWWSAGPDWPYNGEIDTVETVNIENVVQSTLHTSAGCFMYIDGISNPHCVSGQGQSGCGVNGPENSAGPGFNANGGGVYATQWTNEAIYMWFFPRGQIPTDLDQGNTYSWGPPYVTFPFYNCPSWHFNDQTLVINLAFCGDWAGSVFPGGNEACIEYVRNPANIDALSDAYWAINYVKVLF